MACLSAGGSSATSNRPKEELDRTAWLGRTDDPRCRPRWQRREAGSMAVGRAGREGREQVETAVVHEADEAAECRRLAELLNLDTVGLLRRGASTRRIAWWAAPGSGPLPLHLDDVLEGPAEGWIACPRGDDLVFARLTPKSSVRSVAALRGMHSSLAGDLPSVSDGLDDPYARERTRWAYAIHDGLTQVVTASVLELEWMARKVDVEPSEAVAVLTEASVELRRALEEIRLMLTALSPQGTGEEEPLEELI